MCRYFLIALKEAWRQDKTIEIFRFEYDDVICFLAYSLKMDTSESFIVLFSPQKLVRLFPLKKVKSYRIPNIW